MRNAVLLGIAALGAAVLMTWPLAAGIGHLGRTQNSGDGRFAVWNVAWVAHALVTNPANLFDANIFYPHRRALAFSESNIGAGTLAVPVWVATKNPFASHNSVVLFAFALSVVGAWLLARRLTHDSAASATAAVLFAFCPYVFSHTAHIQLLLVGGIPICLLLFHRLADAPSPARGLALGVALAAQALSCAYYGVSVGLTIGYGVLFLAWSRRLWTSRPFWTAVAIAAAVSMASRPPLLPALSRDSEGDRLRSIARRCASSGPRSGARISPRARAPMNGYCRSSGTSTRRCSFLASSRSCSVLAVWYPPGGHRRRSNEPDGCRRIGKRSRCTDRSRCSRSGRRSVRGRGCIPSSTRRFRSSRSSGRRSGWASW